MSDVAIGAIGVVIGSAFTGLFAWLAQRSTAKSAIEVAVMSEWKKLNDGLSTRLAAVESEFATYRTTMSKEIEDMRRDHAAEIEKLRRDHSKEIEEMRTKHRDEMRTLREQNDGLRKQNDGLTRLIAQNSRSTAQLLSDSPTSGSLKRAYGDGDEGPEQ